jgi:hypothetical protein
VTTYICKDTTQTNVFIQTEEVCDCEYREVSPESWEFRYQGPGIGRTDWTWIPQKSLEEIRELGHNPVEVR